jgi:hypothetical protein
MRQPDKKNQTRPPRQSGRVTGLVGALGGAGLTASALLLAPLSAGAAANAVASSQAVGLHVSLPNFTLAAGSAATSADAGGSLSAVGAGVLTPLPSGKATANATPRHSASAPRTCGGSLPSFPAPFAGFVSGGLACGSAAAKAASPNNESALATGEAGELQINLAPLLSQVVKSASPLASALQGVLGQLPSIPQGGESVSSLLSSIEHSATHDQTAEVAVGPSSSSTTRDGRAYKTTAEAKGSVITILPGAGKGGAALAKIIVGEAQATAAVGAGGKTTPVASDNPALVTVEVDAPATGPKTYSVVPGQSLTILAGTPLQSTIKVAAGSVTTAPSGAVTAAAHGVEIDLAQGAGATPATAYNGGLDIELATAQATASPEAPVVAAAHKKPKPASAPKPQLSASSVPNATSPHTGLPWAGGLPLIAGTAALGAGLLGWPRLRRRLRRS